MPKGKFCYVLTQNNEELNPILSKLSYRSGGQMSTILKNKVVDICYCEAEEIIGWALVDFSTESKGKRYYDVMVFVHPKYRRLGIGSKLVKKLIKSILKKDKKAVFVSYPGDKKSRLFFEKNELL